MNILDSPVLSDALFLLFSISLAFVLQDGASLTGGPGDAGMQGTDSCRSCSFPVMIKLMKGFQVRLSLWNTHWCNHGPSFLPL